MLLPPRRSARDQKTCDVQTRNQKEAARRRKECVERHGDLSHHVVQRRAGGGGCTYEWIVQVLFVQPMVDDRKLFGCLCFRYTRVQTSDHHELVGIQLLPSLRSQLVVNRCPQLDGVLRVSEPRRHHPNHGIGLGIQMDGLIQDCGIASEASLPQSPTQDYCRIGGGLVLCSRKASANSRLHSKCRKSIPGACP